MTRRVTKANVTTPKKAKEPKKAKVATPKKAKAPKKANAVTPQKVKAPKKAKVATPKKAKAPKVTKQGEKALKNGPCKENQEYNEKTGLCRTKCAEGKQRNPNGKGNCINNPRTSKRPLTAYAFFVMENSAVWNALSDNAKAAYEKKTIAWNTRNGRTPNLDRRVSLPNLDRRVVLYDDSDSE